MRSSVCETVVERLRRAPRISVVFHWDADGVASAALVLRRLGGRVVGLDVPRIGLYSVDAIPLPRDGSLLLVLDYGLPGRLYDELSSVYSPGLVVIDHHSVEPPQGMTGYCNPVAYGQGSEEDYPANSFLVYRLIGDPGDEHDRVLAALGVAGDLAPYIDAGSDHAGLAAARRLLEGTGVGLGELRRVAELIDSCYRVLDTECLRRAVRVAARNPLGLLGDEQLASAKKLSDELLRTAWEKLEEIRRDKHISVYTLSMDAYITSAIGRRLASNEPGKIIVLVHSIPSQRRGFIYVRSITHRLDGVRNRLRAREVPVAGKTHVLVISYEGNEYGKYLSLLLDAINNEIL